MTTSVTRPRFTTQRQTCKTKTKTKTGFFCWSETGLGLRPTVSEHIAARRVSLRSASVVVASPVEQATPNARPSDPVDVEVDRDDERQRHVERADRREHRVAEILTDDAVRNLLFLVLKLNGV